MYRMSERNCVLIASMTGFARSSGQTDGANWSWEVKSVNGRGLDARLRLPPGAEGLEGAVREAVNKRFSRGHLNITMSYTLLDKSSSYAVNRDLLEKLVALSKSFDDADVNISQLMNVRGVVEASTNDAADLPADELIAGLQTALTDLSACRTSEGVQLQSVLFEILGSIESLVTDASVCAAARPDAVRVRMQTQIAEILQGAPEVSEDRLAQELAILATKGDIREELDRLKAHISSARELLALEEPVGRRLDFLCQEFNREANTVCSKSGDVELTNIGLALKAAVDQMREQVQNVE